MPIPVGYAYAYIHSSLYLQVFFIFYDIGTYGFYDVSQEKLWNKHLSMSLLVSRVWASLFFEMNLFLLIINAWLD